MDNSLLRTSNHCYQHQGEKERQHLWKVDNLFDTKEKALLSASVFWAAIWVLCFSPNLGHQSPKNETIRIPGIGFLGHWTLTAKTRTVPDKVMQLLSNRTPSVIHHTFLQSLKEKRTIKTIILLLQWNNRWNRLSRNASGKLWAMCENGLCTEKDAWELTH